MTDGGARLVVIFCIYEVVMQFSGRERQGLCKEASATSKESGLVRGQAMGCVNALFRGHQEAGLTPQNSVQYCI